MTGALTPGAYLALRRRAAALSIGDVAARFVTEPRLGEIERRMWIAAIEAGRAPVSAQVADALRRIFAFDLQVLDRLTDIHVFHARLPAPRICRNCGCSERDACIEADGCGCGWIGEDLCSGCAPGATIIIHPLAGARP